MGEKYFLKMFCVFEWVRNLKFRIVVTFKIKKKIKIQKRIKLLKNYSKKVWNWKFLELDGSERFLSTFCFVFEFKNGRDITVGISMVADIFYQSDFYHTLPSVPIKWSTKVSTEFNIQLRVFHQFIPALSNSLSSDLVLLCRTFKFFSLKFENL